MLDWVAERESKELHLFNILYILVMMIFSSFCINKIVHYWISHGSNVSVALHVLPRIIPLMMV